MDPSASEVNGALDARDLELVRLPDGSVVAKRGVREVRLKDPAAGALLEDVAELLDGMRTPEAVLAAVPGELRPLAIELLAFLIERRLLTDAGSPDTAEATVLDHVRPARRVRP